MSTKAGQLGITFPDTSVQKIANRGNLYPVKLMNTERQSTIGYHSHAIMNDGSVMGWGNNDTSQLGVGIYTYPDGSGMRNPEKTAFPPEFPGAADVIPGCNNYQACLDINGQLWTWGWNDWGQCGVGHTNRVPTPVNVSLISGSLSSIYGKTITKVIVPCGYESPGSMYVICSDGTLHGTGYNGWGQLGNGNTVPQNYFVRCGTLTGVTDASAGREQYQSMMALSNGQVYNWGFNLDYQLGTGNTTSTSTPTLRNSGSLSGKTITKVYTGPFTQYALASDGTLHGAGSQTSGEFGIGNTNVISTWTQIFTNVKSGRFENPHYCISLVIRNDNTVWISGYGAYVSTPLDDGYGNYYYNNITTWAQVNLPTTINGVAVTPTKVIKTGTDGTNSVHILMSNGWVYAFGNNTYGQLGVGDTNHYPYTNPQVVRTSGQLVEDIASYGYGSGRNVLMILTRNKELRMSGWPGWYCTNSVLGDVPQYCTVPNPVRFN